MRTEYVLTVVRPSEGEAKYGKATVHGGLHSRLKAAQKGADVLIKAGVPEGEARTFGAYDLWIPTKLGAFVEHPGTRLTFCTDTPDQKKYACSCCGRLSWGNRTHCSGCCTGHRDTPACCIRDHDTPACLPENTAHASLKG
jgi:hypothetical protein